MCCLAFGGLAPAVLVSFLFQCFIALALRFQAVAPERVLAIRIGILVNVGMWLERVMIVTSATGHDFMPHNWSSYFPNLIEDRHHDRLLLFLFLLLSAVREAASRGSEHRPESSGWEKETEHVVVEEFAAAEQIKLDATAATITARYLDARALVEAAKKVKAAGYHRIEFFSPVRIVKLERVLGYRPSPVRFWTLIGALTGLTGGYILAGGTALVNNIIVGGKHAVSLIPYSVIGFEGIILIGSIANFMGFLFYTRRYRRKKMPYDQRYSRNMFALVVSCESHEVKDLKNIMDVEPGGDA